MKKSRSASTLVATFFAVVALTLRPAGGLAQDGLKVHISADMEGVVGAVTSDQLGPFRVRVPTLPRVHDQRGPRGDRRSQGGRSHGNRGGGLPW